MSFGRMRVAGLGLVLGLLGLVVGSGGEAAPPAATERPRLAVLVVFDQLRGDYLTRWDELFGPDGFRRLEKEGVWFQNCHYPYAYTVTAAGHASVATGCSPDKHGIVGNEWYDRTAGQSVSCVGSERYEQVPPRARKKADKKPPKARGAAPDRLLAPTVADALKAATGGKGRVVSLSLKDRSAVLPGGKRADACYWLDGSTGLFVTSTFYRDRLHPWAAEFNRGRPAERWRKETWTRLRSDLDYARYSGPDDVTGEGTGYAQGRAFPHPFEVDPPKPTSDYYGALYNSPFGNELLLSFVRKAVAAEKLGSRDNTDLLCVSFSSNDVIGHCWGPDSQEVLDVTLRSDRIVKELLNVLDAAVGKGRYVLVLTADHGVCPLPEVTRRRGGEAARLSTALTAGRAEDFLNATFPGKDGEGRWLEAVEGPWLYLNRALLRERGLKQAEVEKGLARWLEKQTGIQAVYTRTQLQAGIPAGDVVGQKVLRSFYPERSGDLMVIVKPYYLLGSWLTGTTHGTPHDYDTHVPLLAYGPGIRGGARKDAVTPQAAAAILARALGIEPPAKAAAGVPAGLFPTPSR